MINEEIKDDPLYLSIQEKIKTKIKSRYNDIELEMEDVEFLTVDVNQHETHTICLWKGEPNNIDESYWSETTCGDLYESDIKFTETSIEEQQFIKDNWTKLIWQIAKGDNNE